MINYAHRGASEKAPENTFSAFYLGLELGADGIETDIQETADGRLVLFHDHTLKRITGIDLPVQKLTYAELLRLDFGSHKGTRYQNEKIVTLDDFLRYFSGRPVHLALEIKQDGIEKAVLDCIGWHDCAGQVIITSFSWECLIEVRRQNPDIRLGYLTERIEPGILGQLTEQNMRQICPRASTLMKEQVADAQRQGFDVRAWGVANPDLMDWAITYGVDGMTVNFPDKLAARLV
jgi:glycerophosphoryl diester phosphodiesterase